MLNQKFGRLLVIERSGSNKHRASQWKCLCDCGAFVVVTGQRLKSGNTKSCGCLNLESTKTRFTKHGMNGTPIYRVSRHMLDRCYTKNNKEFPSYGGRGIFVSDEWHSFESFFADMGHPPPGMSIDRADNNGGYSKDNCRWATPTEQSMNRRVNRILSVDGVAKPLTAWAMELNINPSTIGHRLRRGWSIEESLELVERKLTDKDADHIEHALLKAIHH